MLVKHKEKACLCLLNEFQLSPHHLSFSVRMKIQFFWKKMLQCHLIQYQVEIQIKKSIQTWLPLNMMFHSPTLPFNNPVSLSKECAAAFPLEDCTLVFSEKLCMMSWLVAKMKWWLTLQMILVFIFDNRRSNLNFFVFSHHIWWWMVSLWTIHQTSISIRKIDVLCSLWGVISQWIYLGKIRHN